MNITNRHAPPTRFDAVEIFRLAAIVGDPVGVPAVLPAVFGAVAEPTPAAAAVLVLLPPETRW
jgi:hypothetical protein